MEKLDYKISLVIVDSDIDLEPTHEISPEAPGIDLMFSTIFKGDTGQAELTHELVIELSVGGVLKGMVFPVGTPIEDILREMFTSTGVINGCLYGGVVNPGDFPIQGDDHRYYYLAITEGRYTHFNDYVVDGYIGMFSWSENTQNWRMLTLWPNNQTVDRWLQSKANIVNNATNGNLAGLDEYGDLTDSGIAASDVATQNDISEFITRSVNDLTNYYLKSETYTKAEVAALIGAIQSFHYEIYTTLPASGEGNVLYLIGPTGTGVDRYEEFVYSDGAFTMIGDTSIDLSNYITTSALNTALANYTTTANLNILLAGKQDILTFDPYPIEDSTNPVQSGGLYSILERLFPNSSLFGGFVAEYTPVSEDKRLYFLTEVSGDLPNFELYNLPDNGKWKIIKWNPRDAAWDWETIDSYTSAQIDQIFLELDAAISGKQNTISDLADIRSGAAAGATAIQTETDPTVPLWAKQSTKPSYDYSEIGNTPDLSEFITKNVNDIANYYLKSETYTKTEVANLIAAINQFHYEIAASTSAVTNPQNNVLYLIGPTGSGADKYEEYVYPDSTTGWVKIGDTSIDLSGYVTTSALNTALAAYITTSDLTTLLEGYQTKIDNQHKLDYSLLDNTPIIPTVPTNVSAFTNDAGYLTQHQDISGKADKVSSPTSGNFAGLDSNGNLTDSGSKALDFATATQGTKADTAVQPSDLASVATSGSYNDLNDKLQINGVTLSGNKTSFQLGLQSELTFDNMPTDNSDNPVKSGGVKTALDAKQDTLVSGTNIKTVNDTSLLGSGNIQINDGVGFQTITTQQDGTMVIMLTNGDTITVDLNHQHPNYYSKVAETTQPSGGMLPDVIYKLGTLTGATTFLFAPTVSGNMNHYYFTFTSGSPAVVPTWPASIARWDGNCVDSTTNLPVIVVSKTYEVSVLDGNAIIKEW